MSNKWFGFFIVFLSIFTANFAMQKSDVGPSKKTAKKSKKVKHESIWRAASNGNLERIKIWLQKDPGLLYAFDEYGQPPFHWAVWKNRHEVIQYLLDQGFDCNCRDEQGKTALHRVNQIKTARMLLQAGADPNVQDALGKTPLHWIDNHDIIELLIQSGADVHIEDKDGKTVLHWAVCTNLIKVATELVTAGANCNAADKDGKTILHGAVIQGAFKTMNFLLAQDGLDINAQDFIKKRSALHWALRMCKGAPKKRNAQNSIALTARMIIDLIANGADSELVDRRHRTPARRIMFMECSDHEKNLLHMAVQYNSLTESHQKKLLAQLKMVE